MRRKDIKSVYVAELSAMPEDLEEQVDVRRMTDLSTFLKLGRFPRVKAAWPDAD